MLAYEADTAWNRGIYCIFSKHKSNYICYFYYFIHWVAVSKRLSKVSSFGNLCKSAGLWGSYGLKKGNPLQFFQNTDPIVSVYLFLYCYLIVLKRVSKVILSYITFKSVGLWGSYGLKQGNPLQNLKICPQIVSVLSPDLLFYLMYQKCF